MEVSMSTLKERIATALTDKISSADVEALIIETEAAITAANAAAEAERSKALDPVGSPDPIKARAAMEGAAFTRDRLLAALPRLRARLKEAEVEEQLARWKPEYERVKAVRDDGRSSNALGRSRDPIDRIAQTGLTAIRRSPPPQPSCARRRSPSTARGHSSIDGIAPREASIEGGRPL
jgi:hypothetical protein